MKKLLLLIAMLCVAAGPVHAVVNINTATQPELETLQGIGPAKAKAIVDYRKKNGPFKSPGDLEKVNGIGPATMKQLRKDITVGGTSTVKENRPAVRQ